MADPQTFRQAWSKFPTGVTIVTTIQPDGRVHGMAANGVMSVSLEPMLVLLSVGHNRNSSPLIKQTRRFAMSILREDQEDIAEFYACPAEERMDDSRGAFGFTERGSAVVDGCLAWVDCHVVREYEVGDHIIFIGAADEIQVDTGRPLVFFGGRYDRLA